MIEMPIPTERGNNILEFKRTSKQYKDKSEKLISKGDLLSAAEVLREAVSIDPDDIEAKDMLAEVYMCMQLTQSARNVLLPLLAGESKGPDGNSSPYGLLTQRGMRIIAMTYMQENKFEFARMWFDLYLTEDPSDESWESVGEIVTFLDEMLDRKDVREAVADTDDGGNDGEADNLHTYASIMRDKTCAAELERARLLINQGKAEEAIRVIEAQLEKYPTASFIRLNLSFACYCAGYYDRAIDICTFEVKKRPKDISLRCNLIVYLSWANRIAEAREHVNYIRGCKDISPRDMERVVAAMLSIGEFDTAMFFQQRIQAMFPFKPSVMHKTAMCFYLIGDIDAALSCYDILLRIDELDSIAMYYKRLLSQVKEGQKDKITVDMVYQIPAEQVVWRLKQVAVLSEIPNEAKSAALELWRQDKELRAIVRWLLFSMEGKVKENVIDLLLKLGDKSCIDMLREFVLDESQCEECIEYVLNSLPNVRDTYPIVYFMNGYGIEFKKHAIFGRDIEELVFQRAWLDAGSLNKIKTSSAYRDVYRLLIFGCYGFRDSDFIEYADAAFVKFANEDANAPKSIPVAQRMALAAAFEYYCVEQLGGASETERMEIMESRGVTDKRFKNAYAKIKNAIDGNKGIK